MTSFLSHKSDDSSDGEPSFTINKAYADKYDTWRQKEEFQKLKDKYGDEVDSGSSSTSSSEDEDAEDLTPDVEREWLKAFAAVKSKDPKIYSKDVQFFSQKEKGVKKEKKPKSMFLKDYERKVILEKGGVLADSDSDKESSKVVAGPSYYEEQEAIKKSIQDVLSDSDSESSEDVLLTKCKKTSEQQKAEDGDFQEWLKSQKTVTDEKKAGVEPSDLQFWNRPDLDEGELFLRDYILNKRYIDTESKRIPSYEEIVNEQLSDDEEALDKQDAFENKYNFRFEEPDSDFIKNYPRTIDDSVRRRDDRRSRHRAEVRDRKLADKQRRTDELKQLKNLKKKEILDKLKKLKEITGNVTVGFEEGDIEGDWDPEAYDKKMQAAFDDDYYEETGEDAVKPVFSDSDDDDEQRLHDDQQDDGGYPGDGGDHGNRAELHCEDADFNMDADFEPSAVRERKNKKKRRKGQLSEILDGDKPQFDPNEKTFAEYMDEYYKLDYDDRVGDLPCRFRYRKVVPNDFGLTTEEILRAPDRELNSWVSLRRTSQYRAEDEELADVRRFRARATNRQKKLRVIPSLMEPDDEESEEPQPGPSHRQSGPSQPTKKKDNHRSSDPSDSKRKWNDSETQMDTYQKKKKKRKKIVKNRGVSPPKDNTEVTEVRTVSDSGKMRKNRDKKRKNKVDLTDERLKAYGINPKKLPYMNIPQNKT